ncbi:MAG: hypothetical protein P8H33_09480 [Crocinitomicaceae bacterium]|nr:hypothetical protein [Crocinitomicaceae bacterium]
MKTTKITTLLVCMLCVLNLYAQRIEETVLKYEYIQQPISPIAGLSSYNFSVVTTYPENNDGLMAQAEKEFQEKLANYPNEVIAAEKAHAERIATYDAEVILAQENFKLETEAFDKLNAIEKLALDEGRPVLRMPSKPGSFRAPLKPTFVEPNTNESITFKPGILADTYLKLEGFEKGTTDALVAVIDMEAFDASKPERKETIKRVYSASSKQYVNQKTYTYETSMSRPTRLILTFNGATIYNDIFEGTGEYTTKVTKTYPNMYQLEKDNVSNILTKINTFINEQHGFVKVPATLIIRAPKNKGDFNDLERAGKLAKRGINPMGSSDGNSELSEAIQIWNTALEESDLYDKKARINSKVTQLIYQNLIEATIYKEDFIKAQDHLILLGEMDLKNSDKRWVESRTAFIQKRLGQ